MDALHENAQRIFDVARLAGDGEPQDFALLIHEDSSLHFIMGKPFSIEGAAAAEGAATVYQITRSRDGVRVQGSGSGEGSRKCCILEERSVRADLLRDQHFYRIASPLLISTGSSTTAGGMDESAIRGG